MVAGKKQNHQGRQRDTRQDGVVAAEQTPGRPGVAPMDKLEEAGNNFLLPVFREILEHHQLGQLVEHENKKSQIGNPPIRGSFHRPVAKPESKYGTLAWLAPVMMRAISIE